MDKTFEIVVDTSCDLNRDLREKYGIAEQYIKSVVVYPNGTEKDTDLDWTDITPEKFFGFMKDKKHILKTGQKDLRYTEEVLEYYLKQGKDVLCILISGKISGNYSSTCTAAKKLMEQYPERKIICVDSERYSTAVGLLCVFASELRASGKTLQETADILEEKKGCIHQMGILDDLFFANRTGRVSGVAAVMGTFAGIKPMADFGYDNGLATVIGKTRGYKSAFETTIKYMEKTIVEPEKQTIFVGHSVRTEQATIVKNMIEERFHPKEIIIAEVGQLCGCSIGPGLVAAFYFGAPISKDNLKEKAIMEELTKKK